VNLATVYTGLGDADATCLRSSIGFAVTLVIFN
jgi:hypothetical protein